MRQSHRLIFNALVSYAARFIEVAVSFVLLPFMVNRLGTARYGVYGLAMSVTIVLEVLRTAFALALTKYVADYGAQEKQGEINRVLGTTCAAGSAVGFAAAVVMIALVHPLARLFGVPSEYYREFRIALYLTAGMVAVTTTMMPYLGILMGFQRYDLVRVSQTVLQVLRLLVIPLWFIAVGPSVTSLAVIAFLQYTLLHLSWAVTSHRCWPWLRGSPRQFRWESLRMLLGFTTIIVLLQLNTTLGRQAVTWVLSGMLSVDFVTYLTIMTAPASFIASLASDLTLTIVPVASKYQALNDRSTLIALLIRGTRYSFLSSAICVVALVPIMRPFLRLWMGPAFEHLAPPMVVIVACAGIGASELCAHNILKGLGNVGSILVRGLVVTFVTLGIIIVAIKWFGASYWAVSGGFSAGYLISMILHNWMCIRRLEAPVMRFIWQSYVQGFIVMVPVMVGGWWITQHLRLTGIVPLGLVGAGGCAVFLGLFALLFSSPTERGMARDLLLAAARRLRFRRTASSSEDSASAPPAS